MCNPISIRSILNPIEEAQESHQKFTNEDFVEMVATTGEEEVDDNQDEKVVATTTMTEKLKALSLLVIMLDVSMPSQRDAHKMLQELQHNFRDQQIKQSSLDN